MATDEALTFEWDVLGEVERGEAVLETLDTLFERLDRHIEVTARQDLSNPHVVEGFMQSCLAVVDMLYARRENTCVDADAFYQNSWEVDLEPTVVPLDVWARGAVVCRERTKLPTATRTGSSVLSDTSRKSFMKSSGSTNMKLGGIEEGRDTERSRPSPASNPIKSGSTSPSRKPTKPKPAKEEMELEDRLREELALRRRRDEIAAEMIKAGQKAREDVAELKKSLKGKDYSYDHKGDVVVTARLDPERMPAMLVQPGMNISDAVAVGSSEERRQSNSGSALQAESKAKSRKDSNGGSHIGAMGGGSQASDDADKAGARKIFANETNMPFLELPNEGQPPPTETIRPTDGVTLSFGRTVKKGAQRKVEGLSDMCKLDYAAYIKSKGHYEKLPYSQGLEFKLQQDKKKAAEREDSPTRQSEAASAPQKGRAMDRRRSSLDSVGPLGLGVIRSEQPSWMADGVPVKRTDPAQKPKKGDINKLLTSSADWGAGKPHKDKEEPDPKSPGKPPGKHTIELRERSIGLKVDRFPRDRQYGYITERDLQETAARTNRMLQQKGRSQ